MTLVMFELFQISNISQFTVRLHCQGAFNCLCSDRGERERRGFLLRSGVVTSLRRPLLLPSDTVHAQRRHSAAACPGPRRSKHNIWGELLQDSFSFQKFTSFMSNVMFSLLSWHTPTVLLGFLPLTVVSVCACFCGCHARLCSTAELHS